MDTPCAGDDGRHEGEEKRHQGTEELGPTEEGSGGVGAESRHRRGREVLAGRRPTAQGRPGPETGHGADHGRDG